MINLKMGHSREAVINLRFLATTVCEIEDAIKSTFNNFEDSVIHLQQLCMKLERILGILYHCAVFKKGQETNREKFLTTKKKSISLN